MTAVEMSIWERLCASLPSSLADLQLFGFCWDDAVQGLRTICLPSVETVHFNLAAPCPLQVISSSLFKHSFPGLNKLRLSERWCFSPQWITEAFGGLKLGSVTTFECGSGLSEREHSCPLKSRCLWVDSMKTLLDCHSRALNSLETGTSHYFLLAPLLIETSFTSLTTLNLSKLNFKDDLNILEVALRAFFESPLNTLILDDREDVPQGFYQMLEKGYISSGYMWPELETLSKDFWLAVAGPGDEHLFGDIDWEDPDLDEADFPHWGSEARKRLESLAQERGIDLKGEWEWWEGYG